MDEGNQTTTPVSTNNNALPNANQPLETPSALVVPITSAPDPAVLDSSPLSMPPTLDVPVTTPTPAAQAPAVPATPAVVNPLAEPTLVIPESDVKQATKDEVSPIEQVDQTKLSEEVEVLNGEVKALEDRIDKMVNSDKPVNTGADIFEDKPAEDSSIAPKVPEPEKKKDAGSSVPIKTSSNMPLNDIYPKRNEAAIPNSTADVKAEVAEDHEESVIGMIGEVVGTIGIFLFIMLALSPVYKSVFSSSSWDAVKLIGWLTALASLFIGFILSLFSRGKWATKILLLIFMLLALVMFLGINGSDSLKTTIDGLTGGYLSYLR